MFGQFQKEAATDLQREFRKHLSIIKVNLPSELYPPKTIIPKSAFPATVKQSIQIVSDSILRQNKSDKRDWENPFNSFINTLDDTQLYNFAYLIMSYYTQHIPDKTLLRDSNYLVSLLYKKCCERFHFPDDQRQGHVPKNINHLNWLVYKTMPIDGTFIDPAIISAIATTLNMSLTIDSYEEPILAGIKKLSKEKKQEEKETSFADYKLFTPSTAPDPASIYKLTRKKSNASLIDLHINSLAHERLRLLPKQLARRIGPNYVVVCKFLQILIEKLKFLRISSSDNIHQTCKNLIKDILLETQFNFDIISKTLASHFLINLTDNEQIIEQIKAELPIEQTIEHHFNAVLKLIPDDEYQQPLLSEDEFKESKKTLAPAFEALKKIKDENPAIYEAFLKRKFSQLENPKIFNLVLYCMNYCYLVIKPNQSIFRGLGSAVVKDFYRHTFEKLVSPVNLQDDKQNEGMVLPQRINILNAILLDSIQTGQAIAGKPEDAVCNDIANAFVMNHNILNPTHLITSAVAKPVFAAAIKEGLAPLAKTPTNSPESESSLSEELTSSSPSSEEDFLKEKDFKESKKDREGLTPLKSIEDVLFILNDELIKLKQKSNKNHFKFISYLSGEISTEKSKFHWKDEEPFIKHIHILQDVCKKILKDDHYYHFDPGIRDAKAFIEELNSATDGLLNRILDGHLDELIKELRPRSMTY